MLDGSQRRFDLELVDGVGHFLQLECPEILATKILGRLAESGLGGPSSRSRIESRGVTKFGEEAAPVVPPHQVVTHGDPHDRRRRDVRVLARQDVAIPSAIDGNTRIICDSEYSGSMSTRMASECEN